MSSQIIRAKIDFLISDSRTTGSHFEKDKIRSITHIIHKNKLQIRNLNIKNKSARRKYT